MPEPRNGPKPKLPTALDEPDMMATVHPILTRGLALAIADDNGHDRGELMRPMHVMARRFLAMAKAYAGPPEQIDE